MTTELDYQKQIEKLQDIIKDLETSLDMAINEKQIADIALEEMLILRKVEKENDSLQNDIQFLNSELNLKNEEIEILQDTITKLQNEVEDAVFDEKLADLNVHALDSIKKNVLGKEPNILDIKRIIMTLVKDYNKVIEGYYKDDAK
ncbi:hypothetical protein phiOC_p194 [Ochrobactrum phage vB_OspM_OC]|nr:hypothetical protein phiOC_p194 [Ochrobactrum phage vB_OspM_OC]